MLVFIFTKVLFFSTQRELIDVSQGCFPFLDFALNCCVVYVRLVTVSQHSKLRAPFCPCAELCAVPFSWLGMICDLCHVKSSQVQVGYCLLTVNILCCSSMHDAQCTMQTTVTTNQNSVLYGVVLDCSVVYTVDAKQLIWGVVFLFRSCAGVKILATALLHASRGITFIHPCPSLPVELGLCKLTLVYVNNKTKPQIRQRALYTVLIATLSTAQLPLYTSLIHYNQL